MLDFRWRDCIPEIETTKKERDITIHSRSTFLQGLLASNDPKLWSKAGINESSVITEWLEMVSLKNNCKSIMELALRYVISFSWIDAVVIGFDNKGQAVNCVENLQKGPLSSESIDFIHNTRPFLPHESLDPSLWKTI